MAENRPKGWKAMPFIIGNETITRMATFGLQANFLTYLRRVYHFNLVQALYVISIWGSITNFAPLVGAIISDGKYGPFKTIAVASFASLMGLLMLTLGAWLPTLHPPSCSLMDQMHHGKCQGPTTSQLAFMVVGLGFLSVGAGGIKPCNVPFGVNQFNRTTEEGQRGIKSFYNWYYTSFIVAQLVGQTLIVYIQDSIGWAWGFGILTSLMACSITLFFVGTRMYVHVQPKGSVIVGIIQVFVAAYRKRRVLLPPPGEVADGFYYDPEVVEEEESDLRLPRTDKYRFLNKAAVIIRGDLDRDGSPTDKWSLSTVQRVEEAKCLLKVIPVWASAIFSFIPWVQQHALLSSQSKAMDRHLGRNFQIPAGSFIVLSSLTIGLWVPFYDRVMVPVGYKNNG